MMIYLAALMSVPKELYEACDIDGAGFFTKHLTVTIPHIMPTIALVTTISSISAMKIFAEIYGIIILRNVELCNSYCSLCFWKQ